MMDRSFSRDRGGALPRARAGGRRPGLRAAIGALVVFDAATFLLAALSHVGEPIPLGFAVLDEPRIVPATIVEGLCGLAFVVAAYAVLARAPWAWTAALGAHALSLGGVLLGMAALAAGGGPHTELNDAYHRVMLAVLVVGLVLVSTSGGRAALRRGER